VPQDAGNKERALQAAEKLVERVSKGCFVSGHDFSRAVCGLKSMRALAPERRLLGVLIEHKPFSAACLAPEGSFSAIQTFTTGSKSRLQTQSEV
jgi:hypothetical protein